MITTWRALLDTFSIQERGTVRGNLTMLRNMGMVYKEDWGLEDWFTPLGLYPLKDKVGIGVVCVILGLYLRNGIYVGHLQWEIMRKAQKKRDDLYVSGMLVMEDNFFARDRGNFTETESTTQDAWFKNFMRGSKLRMGVIKKLDSGANSEIMKAMLVGCGIEWKSELMIKKRKYHIWKHQW